MPYRALGRLVYKRTTGGWSIFDKATSRADAEAMVAELNRREQARLAQKGKIEQKRLAYYRFRHKAGKYAAWRKKKRWLKQRQMAMSRTKDTKELGRIR